MLCAVNKTEKVEEVAPEVSFHHNYESFSHATLSNFLFIKLIACAADLTKALPCKMIIVFEQIMAAANDVQAKKEIYAPYNIVPLDSGGALQSIMQLSEVIHSYLLRNYIYTYTCRYT